MAAYIMRRLLLLIPILIGITLLIFIVTQVMGDPTGVILGQHATLEAQAALREKLGLNDPVLVQYLRFLGNAVRGDFGESFYTQREVIDEIADKLPHTIELSLLALLIATLAGVLVGVVSAVRQYSWLDHAGMVAALLGVSMPIFWSGLMLAGLFSVYLKWLPGTGLLDPGIPFEHKTGFWLIESILTGQWEVTVDLLKHLILPSITLAAYSMGLIARMTRSSLLEVARQDYIRTARAKGLGERRVVGKHALKNAMIPVTTVVGLQAGYLLGGAVLTETVFSIPGMGSLAVTAILNSDFPLLRGTVVVAAALFVLVNLLVDLLYAALDPRIRYS